METEPSLIDLIYCAIIMLIGKEGVDWMRLEDDPAWQVSLAIQLWIRRN